MNRLEMWRRIDERRTPWDMILIGGGATGLGAAVDAAARGYDVALFEQSDFAKGTSSRSTKLIHGGVRYLQQGNVSLVLEALRERGRLLRNAPHLVNDLAFVVPSYEWWQSPFYGVGLKVYDMLAGRYGFGRSHHLSRHEVVEHIPAISQSGLRGGTLYYDGQFDDARLAISLAQTAHGQGATLLNYAEVIGLLKDGAAQATGVRVRDQETGETREIMGRVVINATGPFTDGIRRMDHPEAPSIIAPSQGAHVVLDRSFLRGDTAIMVPHTDDGRVMFAIPWHSVVVLGTTDQEIDAVSLEPVPTPEEIDFILRTANSYLARPATHADILSVFAGIRPLFRNDAAARTSAISREHAIIIDPESGLITIIGGKWTTYRRMAEELVDQAATLGGLEPRPCVTTDLQIRGHDPDAQRFGRLRHYGSDAAAILELATREPHLGGPVHDAIDLTCAEVVWACQEEMARTVDDVLARRSRTLLLNAQGAIDAAERVAATMAPLVGGDQHWISEQVRDFRSIAQRYKPT